MVCHNKYQNKWIGNEATKHMEIWKERLNNIPSVLPFYNVSVQVSLPMDPSDVVFVEEFVYLLRRTQSQLFCGLNDEGRR